MDVDKLSKLIRCLNLKVNIDTGSDLTETVRLILDKYAFASTKFILGKAKEFASGNHKKLMIVLFDPYRVTRSLIQNEPRYDEEIVDFLQLNKFNYFDMNLIHAEDFKNFKLTPEDYYKRYFIGHYSPAGNHFFAFSIKPKTVQWLDPEPITYTSTNRQLIDFKGYLEGID
jgi:hypothetical protein